MISIVLLGTLVLSAMMAHPSRYLVAGFVLTVVLVSLDQARFQPWVYQYAIMLALLVFTSVSHKAVVVANQFVIATLYFGAAYTN